MQLQKMQVKKNGDSGFASIRNGNRNASTENASNEFQVKTF